MEDMADQGMDVPALRNRPSVTGFRWLWEAFSDLSTCRTSGGMGPGPISWFSIQAYAEKLGFTSDETYMLHGVIRHLDIILINQSKNKVGEPHGNPGRKRTRN